MTKDRLIKALSSLPEDLPVRYSSDEYHYGEWQNVIPFAIYKNINTNSYIIVGESQYGTYSEGNCDYSELELICKI